MNSHEHPTAVKLLDTVSTMLDGDKRNEIFVDEVLAASGVSRGSLYHHFGDYPSLVRGTLLRRFSANVDADGHAMMSVAQNATSQADYWKRIGELSAATQLPERAPARAERARLISLARSDDKFAAELASEQDRLTTLLADAIALAQSKGWVDASLSPLAIAVFLQAYSLGRAVDDIAGTHVPAGDWNSLVSLFFGAIQAK